MPPIQPMLARIAPLEETLSLLPDVRIEPKWDGFRAIVFRDGDEVRIDSRNGREITRFFPEVCAAVRRVLPDRCVVDGEIVRIGDDGVLDFGALQLRLHPARSRVERLRAELPATLVLFDLLCTGDRVLLETPFDARRRELAGHLPTGVPARPNADEVWLTPITDDPATARRWFDDLEGAGLDGVIAKGRDLAYLPGKRVMTKVKHRRTADCVVAGYREHTSGPDAVGSLLLGLYGEDGRLVPVGVVGALPLRRRRELVTELAGLVIPPEDHPWLRELPAEMAERVSGFSSRWAPGKSLAFVPLRPERVLEVRYESFQGHRFRHMAQFERWRPDREPTSCGFDQLTPAGVTDLRARHWDA